MPEGAGDRLPHGATRPGAVAGSVRCARPAPALALLEVTVPWAGGVARPSFLLVEASRLRACADPSASRVWSPGSAWHRARAQSVGSLNLGGRPVATTQRPRELRCRQLRVDVGAGQVVAYYFIYCKETKRKRKKAPICWSLHGRDQQFRQPSSQGGL